jgi:type IV secretory pathway VirB10-like protein
MGKAAMRRTRSSGFMVRSSSKALRLSAVVLGVGLLMAGTAARAADDEEDDKTFEEKIIEGIMKGMGATNMDNSSIDYRERSPLVVPPKLDLPPPASAAAEKPAPNWPKDPDEARRKAAIAQRKKDKNDHRDATQAMRDAARPLSPSELNGANQRPTTSTQEAKNSDSLKPGDPGGTPLMPSELGYSGSMFGLFKGNKVEATEFKQEPTRESLTQPPPGYQTPSSSYLYGTGPKESLNKEYNPAAGKYGE